MPISCIVIKKKKCEDKACQYQSVQRFITEYFCVKHIPDFDSLQHSQVSQKTQFQNTLTYPKPNSAKHFCDIFPTKTHRFHHPNFFD